MVFSTQGAGATTSRGWVAGAAGAVTASDAHLGIVTLATIAGAVAVELVQNSGGGGGVSTETASGVASVANTPFIAILSAGTGSGGGIAVSPVTPPEGDGAATLVTATGVTAARDVLAALGVRGARTGESGGVLSPSSPLSVTGGTTLAVVSSVRAAVLPPLSLAEREKEEKRAKWSFTKQGVFHRRVSQPNQP